MMLSWVGPWSGSSHGWSLLLVGGGRQAQRGGQVGAPYRGTASPPPPPPPPPPVHNVYMYAQCLHVCTVLRKGGRSTPPKKKVA